MLAETSFSSSLNEEAERAALLAEVAELRKQARVLRALMDNVYLCVWAIDERGTFTYHDGKGLELAGMQRHQLVGQNVFKIYNGPSADDVRRALAGAFIHNTSFTHGRHWETWHVPARDEQGATVGVIGLTLDITDAKQAEEELRAKLALIEQQQQVIRDLSTPIIEVWDGVLTLPMVGVVDSVRVSEVTEALLSRIVEKNARFAILDLTGVEVVDTKVASHLVSIVNAIRLLGAEGIVTGIRPTVAQTMVALGLDLSSVVTHANLRAGLSFCIRRMAPAPRPAPAVAR